MKNISSGSQFGVVLIVFSLSIPSPSCASADSLLLDADLRAIYCLSYLNEARAFQQRIEFPSNAPESLKLAAQQELQKSLQENQELQNRLKRYIVLRFDYIDSLQLAMASNAGKSDFAKALEPNNPKLIECEKRCGPLLPDAAQTGQCMKQCGQEDATIRRVQGCIDLSFLPY